MQTKKKNVMENKVRISMLCELYGNLLTNKQKECIDNYYNNDLSLSEIAENQDITRQAVRDNIQKGEKKLLEYEENLMFMKKTVEQEKKIEKILKELKQIRNNITDKELDKKLNNIEKQINKI